jgi:hypothetical protein
MAQRLPGWLQWDDAARKIITIPERETAIKRIFELAQAGVSKREIANTIQEEGIPCWGTAGSWTPSYVYKLLTSPAVLGDYVLYSSQGGRRAPTGEVRRGYYPAIIERDQWEYVQQLRGANPPVRAITGRVNNLFPGLLFHGETHQRMALITEDKAEWTYLSSTPPAGKSAEKTSLNYLKFERVFLEFTDKLDWKSLCSNPALIETNGNEPSRKMAKLELEKNIGQIKKLVADGEETMRAKLRAQIRLLLERIDIFPHGLKQIPHLKNTEGYPVYRVKFRTGARKYLVTNGNGELVAMLDEPAANRHP